MSQIKMKKTPEKVNEKDLFLNGIGNSGGIRKKLSYGSGRLDNDSREQLIEYALGIKPEKDYFIGGVRIDGVYPATQLHFGIDVDITLELKEKLTESIRMPMMGFVHLQFLHHRIILTTSCECYNREYWAVKVAEAINNVLAEVKKVEESV